MTMSDDQQMKQTSQRPPVTRVGVIGWLRANLFNTWYNSILTLLILWLFYKIIPPFMDWAIFDAVWGNVESTVCRQTDGACWAFLYEKANLILFGLYPFEEQWRPTVAMAIFATVVVVSCHPNAWRKSIFLLWAAAVPLIAILMWGGILGLTYVPNTRWGGLPLTLFLSGIGLIFGFPIGVLLALGRRSHMPTIRTLCITYIELIRGVPLITILFMASVMFPLFLPTGLTIDKLLRAQIGLIMFASAYLAEAVRGGLQSLPSGQYEAADSLGLSYWKKMRFIILPQALRISIPALVNSFISFFKDTSLVIIIGIFDLMGATKAALTDAAWRGFYKEAYLFTASIYFVFCFFMSKYSQYLEKYLNVGTRR
ncbi:amino acid ABC transporter permease [Fodinicurvata halophila]|uniref:Amino acid ABC transporter permease n=1 Tax=Fodinicurvata halophila TaxID=1419723 RepID=A0ABV8UJT6_9PROT